ncbi:MAG: GC-type dockerin domain-anchored protein [Phycisphaerales bacterium]|jgi:hypothetical protein
MRNVMALGVVTLGAVGTCAPLAMGQARFEAGYQFNDEPEVVRVDPIPFLIFAERGMLAQEAILAFPFMRGADAGLLDLRVTASRGRSGGDETLTRGWTEVTFSDVVFESSGVGLSVRYGGGGFTLCCLDVIAGATLVEEQQFELDGDVRTGTFIATVNSSGPPDVERTGIIEDGIPPGGVIELSGFRVPVNTPVALRVRLSRSIWVPATTDDWRTTFSSTTLPDLAFDDVVFDVPDGVTVQSAQVGIRDNQRVRCITDLDRDGELTIFDFLAFQNLFDANDPTADLDFDGELTIFDFLNFQNAFDAGCP